MRPRGLFGAGTAVWVRARGIWFVSGACYLQIYVFAGSWFGFREEVCEDLTFRRCPRGAGRVCRVGGGLGLVERKDAEINRFCRRYAVVHFILYFAFCFPLLATQLAAAVCATVCAD